MSRGNDREGPQRVETAATELARWAVGNLTVLVNESMRGDSAERNAVRRRVINQLRSQANSALHCYDDPHHCLLSFLAVVTLRPTVLDCNEVNLPSGARPLVNAVLSGHLKRYDLWQSLGKAVEPEEKWWEPRPAWLLDDEPEPPKVAGRYPLWLASTDRFPYSGTRLGRILPTLWDVVRELKWGTTNNGATFHLPTKFPWCDDLSQWNSREHTAMFAALCWAWEQAESGHCRFGNPEGPRFILSFDAVPHGHDRAWRFHQTFSGGHDRARRRAFLSWEGQRVTVRSPEHLVALVAEVLNSDEIELTLAGLPDGLIFHFGSHTPSWPWENIGHHDLAIAARTVCEDCLGLGYTIDAAPRAEERVVRPCPDCCERFLENAYDDSEEDPWPRADDTAFARYSALRKRLWAGRPAKPKGKGGRKPNDIKLKVTFVPISPAEAAIQRARLEQIMVQIEVRRCDAEKVKEEVRASPRPKLSVDMTALVTDFVQAAALAGVTLSESDIEVEALPAPHQRPGSLPKGKQSVYVFCTEWDCLKVGKVGPNSQARYTSQHYSPRAANSTLSRSILRCDPVKRATLLAGVLPEPTEDGIGTWVEEQTTRYNFLVSSEQPSFVLTLLESFLQSRLRPVFEQAALE